MDWKKAKRNVLSDEDVKTLTHHKFPVHAKKDLPRLFRAAPHSFIYFYNPSSDTDNNVGHWTCFVDPQKEYFDPYGKGYGFDEVETLLKYWYPNGGPIFDSDVHFQKQAKDVDTCGRWVSARLNHSNLNSRQFRDFINRNDVYHNKTEEIVNMEPIKADAPSKLR